MAVVVKQWFVSTKHWQKNANIRLLQARYDGKLTSYTAKLLSMDYKSRTYT
jgi:hypothetical protein